MRPFTLPSIKPPHSFPSSSLSSTSSLFIAFATKSFPRFSTQALSLPVRSMSSESSSELVLNSSARKARRGTDRMNAASPPSPPARRPTSGDAGPILGSPSHTASGPHDDGVAIIDLDQPSPLRTFRLRRLEVSDDEGIPLEYLSRYIPSNSGESIASSLRDSPPSEPRQTDSRQEMVGTALRTRLGDESAPVISTYIVRASGAVLPR